MIYLVLYNFLGFQLPWSASYPSHIMDKADNTDGKHFFNICTHYIDKHIRVVRLVWYEKSKISLKQITRVIFTKCNMSY